MREDVEMKIFPISRLNGSFQFDSTCLPRRRRPTHIGLTDYKNRCVECWAIQSSVNSFACIAHSFPCSTLLAALIRLLARSLTHSRAHGKEVFVFELNASISYNFSPLCVGGLEGEIRGLITWKEGGRGNRGIAKGLQAAWS